MEIACRKAVFSLSTAQMGYRFGEFELDPDRFELRRGGEALAAEPQVLSLLILLAQAGDRLVTKDEIVEKVWNGRIVSDAAITSRLKSARQLLGDDGERQAMIRTVRGKGVRFLPDVAVDRGATAPPSVPDIRDNLPPQQVRFCKAPDGTGLAYSVVGDGPPLVKTANWLNHLEYEWESPIWKHWLDELAGRHTLLRYDERGNGLSDWNVDDLSFEAMVEDLEMVVDAAGFETFDLLGISQGCAVSIAYAVRHPERVRRMVLYGGYPAGWKRRGIKDEMEMRTVLAQAIETGWGKDNVAFRQLHTSLYFPGATQEQADWFNELQRISASPEAAKRLYMLFADIDVRHLLKKVGVPTLVAHCRDDAVVPVEAGRFLAAHLKDATFVELDSPNHLVLEHESAWPRFVQHLRAFLAEE